MKIEDAISDLQHWQKEGHKFVERAGTHWSLSSTESPDLYDLTYYEVLINHESDHENYKQWVEGKDYVYIECKIDWLRMAKDYDRNRLRCVVDLKPVDENDLPEWFNEEDFAVFMDHDLHELVSHKADIENYI